MRVSRAWVIMLGLMAVVFFAGCEEDDDCVECPEVEALAVQINATPATPATGATVALTATVTPAGTGRSFLWEVSDGQLIGSTSESASWIVPDADGTYTVELLVGDGTISGTAKKSIVVSDYDPAVDPHFVGDASCDQCHGSIHDAWAQTGHASALESLAEIGMDRNTNCIGCHTVGYDATVANGGYDEQAVARLAGVQCENCHTAGSEHGGDPGLPIDREAELCGSCHEGEHHPTFSEWEESAHGGPLIASAAMRGGSSQCMKCHNGLYAMDYLDDPLNYGVTETPTDSLRISCAVCHDPHGSPNSANLRDAVNDIAIPEGTHPGAGNGRLCIACHNGRRAGDDIEDMIQNGSSHFGPHHSCQGDMLTGKGAYEDVAPDFTFATSRHVSIQDGCVSCHNHHIPFVEGSEAYTGHEFKPIVEACQPCHGSIQDFAEIFAKDDFDGDGSVEGVQSEVAGLIDALQTAIIEATPPDSTSDRQALEDALASGEFDIAVGDAEITSVEQRKAGYNLFYVSFDQSMGVHNATYAIQLLQQSILSLNPGKIDQASILIE